MKKESPIASGWEGVIGQAGNITTRNPHGFGDHCGRGFQEASGDEDTTKLRLRWNLGPPRFPVLTALAGWTAKTGSLCETCYADRGGKKAIIRWASLPESRLA